MNADIITTIIICGIGGALYYFYQRGRALTKPFVITPENSKTIDGELKANDIIGFFKMQNLNHEKQIPFIAKWNDLRIKKIVEGETKPGYEAVFVGVFNNKTNALDVHKVFFAKSLDQKLKDIFGNETLVVLS